MLLANSYFRTIAFSLISLGMIVPAWAAQPCKCGKKNGCCAAHEGVKPSCCAAKSCCITRHDEQQAVGSCRDVSVDCPCCTAAAPPTNIAPQQSTVAHAEQQPTALAGNIPGVIPPLASVDYLTRNVGLPPGHPVLRLHALYRVWLN